MKRGTELFPVAYVDPADKPYEVEAGLDVAPDEKMCSCGRSTEATLCLPATADCRVRPELTEVDC